MGFIHKKRAITVLFGLCVYVFFAHGLVVSSYGLFIQPISTSQNISFSLMSASYTIRIICGAVFAQFSAKILKKVNSKIFFLLVNSSLIIVATLTTFSSHYWQFLILSVATGCILGIGVYVIIPLICNEWFEDPSGPMGIASAATGLGGVIFSPILSSIIDNYSWKAAYWFIAVCILLILLPVTLLFLQYSPTQIGLQRVAANPSQNRQNASLDFLAPSPQHASLTAKFFCSLLFISIPFSSIYAVYPSMLASKGFSIVETGFLFSCMQIGYVLVPILFGLLLPKIKFLKTSVSFMLLSALGLVLLVRFTSSRFLLISLSGFLIAFAKIDGVGLPILSLMVFGREKYHLIYPRLYMLSCFSGAFSVSLYGMLFDFSASYLTSYILIFISLLLNILSATIVSISFARNTKCRN